MARTVRMLVADDSRTTQLFFRRVIGKSAHPVELICVENGQECAMLLERGDLDLAFVAADMPGMSGIAAAGAGRHQGSKTLVILMTASGPAPRPERAGPRDVFDYLEKPFAEDDVEAVIAACRRIITPIRTLIVDESQAVRKVIRRVLEGSIFRLAIEEAGDGPAALERCRSAAPDLVFLDRNLPELDGLATLQRLLACRRDAKVIMISTRRDDGQMRQALECGAVAFLHKPFYPADVDRALRQALGLDRPARADARALAAEPPSVGAQVFLEDVLV